MDLNHEILNDEAHAQRNALATKVTFSLIVLFTLLFLMLVKLVFFDKNFAIDYAVIEFADKQVSHFFTKFYLAITYFGSQHFLIPAYTLLIIIFLLIKNLRKYSWRILITALTGTGVMFGFKYLFGRERPLEPLISHVPGHSFPSGHSFSSLLFFGILAFIVQHAIRNKWLKHSLTGLLFFFSILVGCSRIYLGVHFFTDVLAGFSLAIIWILLSDWFLFKKISVFLPNKLNN